ncbi:MAG: 4'-phosphopantetheinyl transferase [Cyclobacteriaceae bacterium]|jgi:4'-phosphopantetheinyl transferase
MPLLLSKKINPFSCYAVWNISETENQLEQLIHEDIPVMRPDKRSEWIVTRILARYLSELFDKTYQGVAALDSGKPYLIGQSCEISITHSFPMAAVMINLRKACGIDLELHREKLILVQEKFLHEKEYQHKGDVSALCKIWSGKEAIFKTFGDKNLSFKEELWIEFQTPFRATGHMLKVGKEQKYELCYEQLKEYQLCYNL